MATSEKKGSGWAYLAGTNVQVRVQEPKGRSGWAYLAGSNEQVRIQVPKDSDDKR
jgi:hypothetical protein